MAAQHVRDRRGGDPDAELDELAFGTGIRRRLTGALVGQEDAGVISSRESP
jgi:hypothetical protein